MRSLFIPANSDCPCPPSGSSPAGACTPVNYPTFRRGILPLVQAFCPGDTVPQPGRINALWVPEFVVEHFFARGADFSPVTPLTDTDTYTTTDITLTLTAPAVSGETPAEEYLIAGIVIDLMSSNNVAPGITTLVLTGVFENSADYAQTVQLSTGHVGLSRFVLLFSREMQGGAYPSLVRIQTEVIVGENDAPADVVSPTDVLTVVATSVPGTSIRIETLSPVSELWYQAMSAWYANAAPYMPYRMGK